MTRDAITGDDLSLFRDLVLHTRDAVDVLHQLAVVPSLTRLQVLEIVWALKMTQAVPVGASAA